MLACDHCRTLLWDELFGLLEASASEDLRLHLTGCEACRSEMSKAEAQQRLLARVARLAVDVPPFKLPTEEPVPALDEVVLPMRPRVRRFRLRLRTAVAAAVLLCLGLPYGAFRFGLHEHSLAVDNARKRVAAIDARSEEFKEQDRRKVETALAEMRARPIHLEAFGPAMYQPGLLNQYRFVATNLDGQARPVEVTARLVDERKRVLFEKIVTGKGELLVSLPGDLAARPRSSVSLEVVAKDARDTVEYGTEIKVLEPHYITELTTDKQVYQPGDRIFFRSLTLEPFALRPAGRAFHVTYTLYGPGGAGGGFSRVASVSGMTREDGTGGGVFDLKADAAPGTYSISATNTRENRFAPLNHTFVVGAAAAVDQSDKPSPAPSLSVEFFPEGGCLLAGVPNRVYFRAHTPQGKPLDLDGQLVDSAGRVIVPVRTVSARRESSAGRGLGVFTFTPSQGESYRVRIVSGPNDSVTALPLAQPQGITLSVANPIIKEGNALPLVLHSTKAERRLIVTMTCRGSLVAEEAVTVKPGAKDLVLSPADGARGVLRVTVWEPQPVDADKEALMPVAERLVYSIPADPLALSIETDRDSYRPGEHVILTLRSADEKRQPEKTWLSVSTGKRDALSQASGWLTDGLPPSLQFSSDLLLPEDIEMAYFSIQGDPQAQAAVDLFLGTQGWRPVSTAIAGTENKREASGLAMFALDNLGQAQKRYAKEAEQIQKARSALDAKIRELDRAKAEQLAVDAVAGLASYDERMHGYARLGVGGVAIIAFIFGIILFVVSVVGMARGSAAFRPRFVGGFVALLFCLLAVPLAKWIGKSDVVVPEIGNPLAGANNPDLANWVGRGAWELAKSEVRPRTGIFPISSSQGSIKFPPPQPLTGGPLPLQEFAFDISRNQDAKKSPATLVWKPDIALDGQTQVSFDLPKEPAVYRVHVEGHTQSGRLGVADLTIDTRGK